ncbi:MAG TPA: 4'-phosphopantetheinyl transferase superfamily protein [Kribbella sp.]|nr:4'-phosphopantetheinyl transferase superfamily protein [Kribbella sp.]
MSVEIWWAHITDARPGLADDLDADERDRLTAYAHEDDRARFLVGCAVVRRVLASLLSTRPAAVVLDRSCGECGRPHGKVDAIDAEGIQLSVSHSGDLIAVAFHPGTPVGVDVELIDPAIEINTLATVSLAEVEAKELNLYEPAARARAFTTYWTRKEAIVKATGHGMRADLREVVVAAPDQPAALRSWPAYDGPVELVDLVVEGDYAAAVAVLSADPVTVRAADARALLSG